MDKPRCPHEWRHWGGGPVLVSCDRPALKNGYCRTHRHIPEQRRLELLAPALEAIAKQLAEALEEHEDYLGEQPDPTAGMEHGLWDRRTAALAAYRTLKEKP